MLILEPLGLVNDLVAGPVIPILTIQKGIPQQRVNVRSEALLRLCRGLTLPLDHRD